MRLIILFTLLANVSLVLKAQVADLPEFDGLGIPIPRPKIITGICPHVSNKRSLNIFKGKSLNLSIALG